MPEPVQAVLGPAACEAGNFVLVLAAAGCLAFLPLSKVVFCLSQEVALF